MFQGSIPATARSIVKEIAGEWSATDVYIGCSGNFTIERTLDEHNRFRLHGNDVTLYTSALGRYFAGEPVDVWVQERYLPEYDWLIPYLDTPERAAATVLLASRMVESLGKNGPYYTRLLDAWRQQWPNRFVLTLARLQATPLRLGSFTCGDVCDYVQTIPKDAGFLSFPPFWAGGYETMWKSLESLFGWDAPSYPRLTHERINEMLATITDRREWFFSVPVRLLEYESHLKSITQTSSRAVTMYCYASNGPARIALPAQASEPIFAPRLGPDEELGATLTLARLTPGQFNTIRAQYLSRHIRPGDNFDVALGVQVDGVMIGAVAFFGGGVYPGLADVVEGRFGTRSAYMLTDFAVPSRRYPRLSRLVLAAALSREAQLLIERSLNRRIRSIYTTAFSKNPSSMKYRGLMDLITRTECSDADVGYQAGYKLSYAQAAGRWSLDEAYTTWSQKHRSPTSTPRSSPSTLVS